jgi:hypothetical protein
MEWQHIYASPADKYKQNMQMYVGTSEVHTVKAVIS